MLKNEYSKVVIIIIMAKAMSLDDAYGEFGLNNNFGDVTKVQVEITYEKSVELITNYYNSLGKSEGLHQDLEKKKIAKEMILHDIELKQIHKKDKLASKANERQAEINYKYWIMDGWADSEKYGTW